MIDKQETYLKFGTHALYGWKATAALIGLLYGFGFVCAAVGFAACYLHS